MTDLPFVHLDAVYHIGDPLADGRPVPRGEKSWDFEFGLYSVSQEPEAWRDGWAGPGGVIYEIAHDRQLCLVDADLTLEHARGALEHAAIAEALVTPTGNGFAPTDLLYDCLRLTRGSTLGLTGRSFSDQALQAALAALVSFAGADACVDGLWWSDVLGGAMRTERGGVFQHKLGRYRVSVVSAVPPVAATVPAWRPSSII